LIEEANRNRKWVVSYGGTTDQPPPPHPKPSHNRTVLGDIGYKRFRFNFRLQAIYGKSSVSNVSDAQINRGGSLLAKISGCSPYPEHHWCLGL